MVKKTMRKCYFYNKYTDCDQLIVFKKYLPTNVTSACVRNMKEIRFLYFDINSKIIRRNIM